MKNKILLTGATGQLGMQWQSYLAKRGVIVSAYGSAQLDITDEAKVNEVFDYERPDYVINCAAYTAVDKAEEEFEKARQINAHGTSLLAKASAKHEAKLVHYSTDYVFSGSEQDRIDFPRGYAEYHPTDPINVYGKTKLEGENEILKHTEDYIIIRVSWLCGSYGSNFVRTMLRLGAERDHLKIINDQYGAPTFTKNVVENSVALLKQDFRGIMHVSSSGLTNWYEFADMIFLNAGKQIELQSIPTSEYPTPAKRPAYSKLDISELKNIPGSRIISWNEGLEDLMTELKRKQML